MIPSLGTNLTANLLLGKLEGVSKILFVEDDEIEGRMYNKLFTHHGYETLLVTNGNEVVAKVKEWHPDLIFLDLMLPGMNGFEVLNLLHHDEATMKIPVVTLSNLSDITDVNELLKNGAARHVVKGQTDEKTLLQLTADILAAYKKPASPDSPRFGEAGASQGGPAI
jgi:two-component system, OmpR family, alkaline phosphatase synthesis response regulator PhoP